MTFHLTLPLMNEIVAMADRIEQTIYEPVADLEITAWTTNEPLPYSQRQQGTKASLHKGEKWGDLFDCAWFRFDGKVPDSAAGKNVVLIIDVSGEGLVVDREGNPLQCLTTASSFYDLSLGRPGKRIIPLEGPTKGGEPVEVWVDAGNNDLFGILQNKGTVQEACIALYYPERFGLYYDYSVLLELLKELPEKSPRHQKIVYSLWRARNALSSFADHEVETARQLLARELGRKNGDAPLMISAVGHAHLDLAWLWPIRETIRKGARTFSNVLRLMEHYPDFHFCASQPQLYQWMKEHYPALYEQIKARIAEGRWEPIGATWVEPDANATWGESLVRQLLYGKRFMKEEFGKDVRVLFLPDTFGYSGALPQLMRKAGIEYFVTTKLSWDRYNTYPHHTFFWEGIDGSRVLVHMPPEGTYNSSAAPRALRKAEIEYLDKPVSEHCMIIFGIGDGGGGPGTDHLERLAREKNLEGLPPVTQEPMQKFLERLETEQEGFHRWSGELFLACHQGTYTTQGRNKRNNRAMEVALRDLELVSVFADVMGKKAYPRELLEKIWKEVLLYQFHDILPGSSITRVYDETSQRYAALRLETSEIFADASQHFAARVDTSGFADPFIAMNTVSWPRHDWITVNDHWYQMDVPSLGYVTMDARKADPVGTPITAEPGVLENEILRVEFDGDGCIRSITDKEHGREVLSGQSGGNQLVVFEDRGDAWDFTWDYELRKAGSFKLVSTRTYRDGPCGTVQHTFEFGTSKLVQDIRLKAGSRRIDFATHVDWRETGKMLRAIFPVNVQCSEAVCEIQFGHIKRPTHRNTSWDQGKYEIPAQKWIDLSQRNYGVALLKDCKYGHRAFGNVLDIDLLRSPTYPDPQADKGMQEFTYALYPHPGDHITGGVIRAAYEFNYPLRTIRVEPSAGDLPPVFSFLNVDAENVIVEAVKKSEDGESTVVRLYESCGIDIETTILLSWPLRSASLTDLLEENAVPVTVHGNTVTLRFKPFEILTLHLEFERPKG